MYGLSQVTYGDGTTSIRIADCPELQPSDHVDNGIVRGIHAAYAAGEADYRAVDNSHYDVAHFRRCLLEEQVLLEHDYTRRIVDLGVAELHRTGTYYTGPVQLVCNSHMQICRAHAMQSPLDMSDATVKYTVALDDPGCAPGLARCLTYNYSFSMEHCSMHIEGAGNAAFTHCVKHTPVLDYFPRFYTDPVVKVQSDNPYYRSTYNSICMQQEQMCSSIPEHQPASDGCEELVGGCRTALKHLHAMLYREDPNEQQCNNFALKSVRGFFHDHMSADIEGSILFELHQSYNVGLCQWSKYINTLSDATMCDPGSIIAMAGELGFDACGVDLWNADTEAKPHVNIGRGYQCKANYSPRFHNMSNGHRLPQFNDIHVASSAAATEEHWYALNGHAFAEPGDRSDRFGDGEIEYSGEATASSHVIGRVTCPVTGENGVVNPHVRTGFFHGDGLTKGRKALQRRVVEGTDKLADGQCNETTLTPGGENNALQPSTPTTGLRTNAAPNETNFNAVGGLCGMPTHFLGSVHVGNQHRTARWMINAQRSTLDVTAAKAESHGIPSEYVGSYKQDTSENQLCGDRLKMFLPYEIAQPSFKAMEVPSTPELDAFLAIAWDGIGTITSAWDSCDVGCEGMIEEAMQNRLCGGSGLADNTLRASPPPPPPSRDGTPSSPFPSSPPSPSPPNPLPPSPPPPSTPPPSPLPSTPLPPSPSLPPPSTMPTPSPSVPRPLLSPSGSRPAYCVALQASCPSLCYSCSEPECISMCAACCHSVDGPTTCPSTPPRCSCQMQFQEGCSHPVGAVALCNA